MAAGIGTELFNLASSFDPYGAYREGGLEAGKYDKVFSAFVNSKVEAPGQFFGESALDSSHLEIPQRLVKSIY